MLKWFTIKNILFGTDRLTKVTDPDRFSYSEYAIFQILGLIRTYYFSLLIRACFFLLIMKNYLFQKELVKIQRKG